MEDELNGALIDVLEPLLGRFTVRRAIDLAAKDCGRSPETLRWRDFEAVVRRLTPMLRTLLGAQVTRQALGQVEVRVNKARSK